MAAKIDVRLFAVLQLFVGAIMCQDISNDIENKATKLKLYWNVPTFQCSKHNITFAEAAKQFEITQNVNDSFWGDKISILYDPGSFPALLKEAGTDRLFFRNGGIPQQGNLSLHLDLFKEKVDQLINEDFRGVGIIDFESWRPVFRQNFGNLQPYKDVSKDLERRMHPFWPNFLIEQEARRRFEKFARIFMEETLIYVTQLRPNGTWGYYAYPYCFNSQNGKAADCPSEVKKENDEIEWLFETSEAYFPSLYLNINKLTTLKHRMQMIEGRIRESKRIRRNVANQTGKMAEIYPYFWYKYQDTGNYLSKDDMYSSLSLLKSLDVDGVIMWGSSNDVNSKSKCEGLLKYVETVLGPVLLNL